MSEEQAQGAKAQATVIKKYANRRLYNTATSTYVTLDDLAVMVKNGQDFLVYDAKSGDDITRSVLTQIIFEEENKGGAQTLLPVNFLRQLIKFYGDQMQGMVPSYLEFSLDNLTKDQDKIRKQVMDDRTRRAALYERFVYSQKFSQTDPWEERVNGREAHEFSAMADLRSPQSLEAAE